MTQATLEIGLYLKLKEKNLNHLKQKQRQQVEKVLLQPKSQQPLLSLIQRKVEL